MSKFKRIVNSFTFNIVSSIFILIIVFGIVLCVIGYASFTDTMKKEYKITTYHMAYTATSLIDGTKLNEYLEKDESETDMYTIDTYLFQFCNKMNVTLLYVYTVDTTDYRSATVVFDEVNEKEDKAINPNGHYDDWEKNTIVGPDLLSENYSNTYKDIYEGKIEYGTIYRTSNLRKGIEPHITTVVPIYDKPDDVDNRNVVGLLHIQRPMSELVAGRRPYVATIVLSTIAILIVVCVSAGLFVRHEFVKPISTVINETRRFSKENVKDELKEKRRNRILEIEELSQAIDKMEDDMIKYIDDLTKATTAQKKAMVELNIAKDIQESSIPNVFPERKDFDLFAYMLPAKEVGGDFYNFIMIDDTHIGLVMADVSGKGIPAALFMMASNILLSEKIRIQSKPSEALEFLNSRICLHNKTNMFVTVWVGILDLTTGHVVACNAGHDDPVICRKKKNFEINKTKHCLAVGALDDAKFTDYEFDLEKGDKLFLYTDGVVEATNMKDELFGFNRMVETLNLYKNKAPKEIIKGVKMKVDEFAGKREQFDDITMLCIELKED
jgi:sigma-B regulation protein RsbU (phosphoserine phosphatase)